MRTLLFTAIFCLLAAFPLTAQRCMITTAEPLPCLNRTFAVQVHLVRDSLNELGVTESEVLSVVDTLNMFFEPICVRFEVCGFNIIDNFQYSAPETDNEWEQARVKYNYPRRINLYVVDTVDYLTDEKGYADTSDILDPSQALMIEKEIFKGEALWLVHTFGHYAGLLDTNNEPGSELADGSNCATTGDLVCDTPADPLPNAALSNTYMQAEGCRFVYAGLDPNGDFYIPYTGNLMARYSYPCWCGFTYGQYVRMADRIGRSLLW